MNMSTVIAGIYEIEQQIGAGGGGIVYLGRHIRLNKTVVLKADKRRLSVGTEKLRREVDMLKNLSQTYIPQVYDFVQENETVYTVMDYIDGISMDKVLAQGNIIPQKDVVKWACQLLEALNYLHNQKPHGILHGDIKPANIMLRSDGDICLIDFNIALALGEDGAVKVGFSRGYASPEHYGSDYTNFSIRDDSTSEKTQVDDDPEKTLVLHSTTTSHKKEVLLDVRSDIYSLGATLYHFLSGRKPEQSALEVRKLTASDCSPEIAAIINKAMNPDPNARYQSAAEMLEDFLSLRVRDRRVKKNKKILVTGTVVSACIFMIGGLLCFTGVKQTENHQKDLKLASYSQKSLKDGDVGQAIDYAMQAVAKKGSPLEADTAPEAEAALADALGVYDLSDGFKSCGKTTLPSEPFDVTVSPNGSRYAVVYAYEAAVYDMEEKEPIVTVPIEKSALSDCVFSDEDTIIFAGENGVEAYSIAEKKVLWTGNRATNIAISGNRECVAAVNRAASQAQIYSVKTGMKIAECDFGKDKLSVPENDTFADAKNYIFALDQEGGNLAVSFSGGGLTIFNIQNPDDSLIILEESDYSQFSGGFCGDIFAFGAGNDKTNFFGMVDIKKAEYAGNMESDNPFCVQADESGIYLANENVLEKINADTFEEKELAYVKDQFIEQFAFSDKYSVVDTDQKNLIFFDAGANRNTTEVMVQENDFVQLTDQYAIIGNRNEAALRIYKLISHENQEVLSYNPEYEHDEARISQDQKNVMLFQYDGFRIYDRSGEIIAEETLPNADQIYDQQYRRKDGKSYLEVTWYDGTVRCYGEDGKLMSETTVDPPSKDLVESFETDKYRIESSLHDAPKVYDRKSGKFITDLEQDAYLTYVTEAEPYGIIIQYMRSTGEKYGILYDQNLNELATMQNLTDVYKDTLVFDYPSGDIRSCHIYTLEKLIQLGETQKSSEISSGGEKKK